MKTESIQPVQKAGYFVQRCKSIQYAFNGLVYFFKTEKNPVIHLTATILVVIASILFPVNRMELLALILTISAVWVSEMINTAIEKTIDFITEERHESIRRIKDMAAGAVLVASLAALLTGLIIFLPKIFYA